MLLGAAARFPLGERLILRDEAACLHVREGVQHRQQREPRIDGDGLIEVAQEVLDQDRRRGPSTCSKRKKYVSLMSG